jgi:hypothetical protein
MRRREKVERENMKFGIKKRRKIEGTEKEEMETKRGGEEKEESRKGRKRKGSKL